MKSENAPRVYKTAWFSKAARKARIDDEELCRAIESVAKGQADDLGGGVFKKRLDKNRHRSIMLAKTNRHWIFQYLFAKRDRANITDEELKDFRVLAKTFGALSENQMKRLVDSGDLTEICA